MHFPTESDATPAEGALDALDALDAFHTFDAPDHPFIPFDMEANVVDVQDAFRIQEADLKTWDAWDSFNSTFMKSELPKSENPEQNPEPIPIPAPDGLFYTWIHSDDNKSSHVQHAIRNLHWDTVPGLETVPLMTVEQFQHTFMLASGV